MAIVAISGPSSSGKTELFNNLKEKLHNRGVVFISDIFHTVWSDLVEQGLLMEEEDINKDEEILCCFIQRVINYYKECIDTYKDSKKLVIIDSCWIDLAIYSTLNMWYKHVIKEVQESLLSQLADYDKNISRVYITQYDESKNVVEKYRSRFKRYNVKYNRPLEIQYYRLSSNLKNALSLPRILGSDDIANYIIDDLRELGYL